MLRSPDGAKQTNRRLRRLRAALAASGALAVLAPAAGIGAPLTVVYGSAEAANAIFDGAEGLEGLATAHRQAPVMDDPRWPADRLIGKVSGEALASLATPEEMAATLWRRAHLITAGGATTPVGGRVGVDEIAPADWSVERSASLAAALRLLGDEARRVIFYASPALVEQVGRRDPRKRLPPRLAGILRALNSGGHTYLEVYRGSLEPFPLKQMANHLTRWWARWPDARERALHVLVGPPGWTTQEAIWNRVRATPAGRAMLANGPGAFGMRTADDGRAWLAAYRGFLAHPEAPPPSGEARIVPVGRVRIFVRTDARLPAGSTFKLRIGRPGDAIVLLRPRRGKRRIIGRVSVRSSRTTEVRIPPRTPPGRWRIMVFMSGEGIRDKVNRNVRIVDAPRKPAAKRPPPAAGSPGSG